MSIKSFADLQIEGEICQFMGSAELIEATSQGFKLRCMLKPSADFSGAYVAEVWALNPESEQDELQGILAVMPDEPNGTIHVLRGKTLDELKEAMRAALANDVYERILVEIAPMAMPVTWRTESKIIMDLAGQGTVLH
jgi:hypothetical protein